MLGAILALAVVVLEPFTPTTPDPAHPGETTGFAALRARGSLPRRTSSEAGSERLCRLKAAKGSKDAGDPELEVAVA